MNSDGRDEVSRILSEQSRRASSASAHAPAISQEDFDEVGYIRSYPDVADAIASGNISSGYEHYFMYGRFEGRQLPSSRAGVRDQLVLIEHTPALAPSGPLPRLSVEALLFSRSGGIMVVGWIDDSADPLDFILIDGRSWNITLSASNFVRVRRQDVEGELGTNLNHPFGFVGFHFKNVKVIMPESCKMELVTATGTTVSVTALPRTFDDFELRDVALSHIAEAKFFGNYQADAISNISRGFGQNILAINQSITRTVTSNPYIERFGTLNGRLEGSIVVCLYGRAEYLFLQSALFSNLPGIDDYEFIYVSNSPELAETLLREAKLASRVYDLRITVVLLSGNAGFGAANNAAVQAALSNRILNVNPDVFPYDVDWARKHSQLVKERPKNESKIFGAPLYYDDSSLMHGGMYFELDSGVLLHGGKNEQISIVRVEHYGKGAPVWASQFTRARPIPAVTGAFISSDRGWYERLGGFTEDYVFGHYEDADLCLKSMTNDVVPWMQDLRLWHLEGKGSTRRPLHEGGSIVNRWLFSSRWSNLIAECLRGPKPEHHYFSSHLGFAKPFILKVGNGFTSDGEKANIAPSGNLPKTPPSSAEQRTQNATSTRPDKSALDLLKSSPKPVRSKPVARRRASTVAAP